MNKEPKIFIGPMSINIIDAIIEYSKKNDECIGIIPSRRQIDYCGGYVNNWTTREFHDYIKKSKANILLVRDHCGPTQGYFNDDGIESFIDDCNYFDVIHIDVWKKYKDYNEGLQKTIEFIKTGYSINKNIQYEVGTEESIRPTTEIELDCFISDLKKQLPVEIFSKIKYIVIQSGTFLKGNTNIGNYDQERLKKMIDVVKKYGLLAKEHNGDYLTNSLIASKFKNGLNCINIAPEFGQIETKIILEEIKSNNIKLFDDFYQICVNSGRWIKWVSPSLNPEDNKDLIINITGHYVLSDYNFLKIKEQLDVKKIDKLIYEKVYKRLSELTKLSNFK